MDAFTGKMNLTECDVNKETINLLLSTGNESERQQIIANFISYQRKHA